MAFEIITTTASSLLKSGVKGAWFFATDEEIKEALDNPNLESFNLSLSWEDFQYSLIYGENKATGEDDFNAKCKEHHLFRIAKLVQLIGNGTDLPEIEIDEDVQGYVTDGNHRLRAYQFLGKSFQVKVNGEPSFISILNRA